MPTTGIYRTKTDMAIAALSDSKDAPDVSPYHARSNDATKLTLPISVVVMIVITVAGFAIQQAMSLAAVRSDVRDIKTLMSNEERMRVVERENVDLKLANMKSDIEKSELRKALLEQLNPAKREGR